MNHPIRKISCPPQRQEVGAAGWLGRYAARDGIESPVQALTISRGDVGEIVSGEPAPDRLDGNVR
jgi:hypothetical protein